MAKDPDPPPAPLMSTRLPARAVRTPCRAIAPACGMVDASANVSPVGVSMSTDKPTGLTFAEASTIPQAGAIALQGVRTALAGSRVLINGAGGGSGSFAIQLCADLGAHITGVDNAAKQDFMRSLGADDVIDYGREDFTRATQP